MPEKLKNRKGIFLTFHMMETLLMLPPEQQEKLMLACYAYHKGDDPDLSDAKVAFAFRAFKEEFDAATAHYKEVCKARTAAINERWKKTNGIQTDTNVSEPDSSEYKSNTLVHQEQVQEQDIRKKNTPHTPPLEGGKDASPSRSRSSQITKAEAQEKAEAYTGNQELRDALLAFVESRRAIRKPITAHGLDLALRDLDRLGGTDEALKTAIVNQSVLNGWQGLFALKESHASQKAQPVRKSWAELEEERSRAEFLRMTGGVANG